MPLNLEADTTSAECFLEASESGAPVASWVLAQNPDLDPEKARELAASTEKHVLYTLAANENIPEDVQEALHYTEDSFFSRTRRALAQNINLSEKLQLLYSASGIHPDALGYLAGNLGVLPHVQDRLKDRWDDVDRCLAKNPGLTLDMQRHYAESSVESIRTALCVNPNLGPDIQLEILDREDGQKNPNYHPMAAALAQNKNLCRAAQDLLVRHHHWMIHAALGGNKHLTWDDTTPVQFIKKNLGGKLADYTSEKVDSGELEELGTSWTGTLAELVEAIELTRR